VGEFVVHFFSAEKTRRLATGHKVLQIGRLEEGSLPRDLFAVTLQKGAEVIPLPMIQEVKSTGNPMEKFQAFFEATFSGGVLEKKTKHLVALGVSLAVACDC
jgi:alkylhydroperoxidase/carboxymuconolactone decarboxylase family protein YurZ